MTHLTGAVRVNLVNYLPACTGSPGWWLHRQLTPATGETTTPMAAGQSRAEESQGTVRPAISAAGVPAAEMAYGVDLGTFVLEGSDVLENRATDIGGAVGEGGGKEAGEGEDVFGTIAGSGGSGGAFASTRGRR